MPLKSWYWMKQIECLILGLSAIFALISDAYPAADKRLSMLFSATFTYRVHELAYEHMNNPESIVVEGENITAEKITESVYYPSMDEKIALLIYLLNQNKETRSLVFVNTKYTGDRIHKTLRVNDFKVGLLSGDIHQSRREKLLSSFKAGTTNVLVATDVAARGLHIPEVAHVFNYDLPQDSEDYVHRIGRTARAGATGAAISFACEQYAINLPDIEDYIDHKIPSATVPHDELPDYEKPAYSKPKDRKTSRTTKKPSSKGKESPAHTHKQKSTQQEVDKPANDKKQSAKRHPKKDTKKEIENQTIQPLIQKNITSAKSPDNSEPLKERTFSRRGHEIPALG